MWFLANDVPCGDFIVPGQIAGLISTIVTLIKIAVPIILIILGMLDMGKAVASQKEDEIKKGQKTLISRCIAAAIVFFVVAIVQLVLSIIDPNDDSKAWACAKALINGASENING